MKVRGDVFRRLAGLTVVAMFLAISCGEPHVATASPTPPLFWHAPSDGSTGAEAGRLSGLDAIAVNPKTGDIYVVEQANARVSQFDPWGQFVRAWGWGVIDGALEFQICTAQTGCQAGSKGSGEGQFDRNGFGGGIAVAPDGSVYVGDFENHRVEKFSGSGSFLLEFGEAGTGPGQFAPGGSYRGNIAVDSDGTVYVGEENRLQGFEATGSFKEEIPFEGELEVLKNREFRDLAIDANGNFYATADELEEIIKFNTSGELVSPGSFPVTKPRALSVDDDGNLFTTEAFKEVVEFDAAANLLIAPGSEFARVSGAFLTGVATSGACGINGTDLLVPASEIPQNFIAAYGPPPDPKICPPPVIAPTIDKQFASSVSTDSAVVKAGINPHFWQDTVFFVEYGTGKCSEGGCTFRQPMSDQVLTDEVADKTITTAGVALPGLEPGTDYHFRFVAESGGGGPILGGEGTFSTFAELPPPPKCPNDAFRTGLGKLLPDCRAYEMASPVDKGGGEIFTLFNSLNERASLNQSSLSGDSITYSSYRAFADPESAPATVQYLATRQGSGWASKAISPPRGTPHQKLETVETQFRAFSDDLCNAWLYHDTDPPLAPDAPEDFPNLYKTDLCDGEDSYEALTNAAPIVGKEPSGEDPYNVHMQGFSTDGTHAVFRALGKLTASAAATDQYQCYEHFEGKLRLVSVLPSGQPNPTNCSIGVAYASVSPHTAQVHNAVSEDGSRIYWTAGSAAVVEKGRIYLRMDGKNPTLAVSQAGEALSKTTAESNYWTASPDGAVAIFSTGNLLAGKADAYEYRLADKSTHPIAGEVRGYLGSSEDASVIYLASEEALAGANGEGKEPVAGEANLYRYEVSDDSFHFIAVLPSSDAKSGIFIGLSPLASTVSQHTARVSEDGRVAAFMSTASLTGFDNTDANSGKPDAEVFRYDASANGGEGGLTCVSCNPTGAAPSGLEPKWGEQFLEIWVAAQIPGWESPFNAPRVLPEEGERVLFESYEPLVARDVNGKQDVYQWSAVGAGSCEETSGDFSEPNEGCVSLISSGQSSRDSEFVDASADGRDVFFTTASSLVPQDPALIDLYDAREGGGFPPPLPPATPCEPGANCQGPGPAPGEQAPASQSQGEGNVVPKPKPHCPRGKAYSKKKGHCVKKHAKRHKHKAHKANESRRPAR